MSRDVTQILEALQAGRADSADRLLPLVYDELRRLASRKLAQERPGQTLNATALVHEAYLRLVGSNTPQQFDGRRHFFAAAAESMRRILVESARRKQSLKRGGHLDQETFEPDQLCAPAPAPQEDILALDAALNRLTAEDPTKAELVKLRYFAGLTLAQAAEAIGISHNTADRYWAYAKAYLFHEMTRGGV
jgi:RNA polymerase sigma factor (TIGR02999 family)